MPFAIINPKTGFYLCYSGKKSYSWETGPEQASRFAKEQGARNFLIHNAPFMIRDADVQSLRIVRLESGGMHQAPAVQPPGFESIDEGPESLESSCIPAAPDSHGEEGSPFCEIADEAQAWELISNLSMAAEQMTDSADGIYALKGYYTKELRLSDLETLDLLHKIEFSDLDVAAGFLMYRQLRELRYRRRRAKDSLNLLHIFEASGLLRSIRAMKPMLRGLKTHNENRTYFPRVRDDLFEAFPPVPEPRGSAIPQPASEEEALPEDCCEMPDPDEKELTEETESISIQEDDREARAQVDEEEAQPFPEEPADMSEDGGRTAQPPDETSETSRLFHRRRSTNARSLPSPEPQPRRRSTRHKPDLPPRRHLHWKH